ncbi:MAG TPA: HEAT repeat domain-containing protein [Vicinamibacteria bacterium]|nr:HEAT repeat domain-containing protein [Vicinamibacteria bacterium]
MTPSLWSRWLVVIAILALAAPAAAAPPPPSPHVVVKDGLVTVDVHDARLDDVLRLVGERAGVRVTILGRLDARLTQSFARLPIGDAIARLVRGHSFALAYSPAGSDGGTPTPTHLLVFTAGADRRRSAATTGAAPPARSRTDPTAAPATPAPASPGHHAVPAGPSGSAGASTEVRQRVGWVQSLEARAREGDEEALAALTESLGTDPSPLVRSQAAAVLGLAGAADSAPAVTSALTDHDGFVRLHAARALGRLGGAAAVPALRSLAGSDPDPRVRRVAVRGLGGLLRQDAAPVMAVLSADPDVSVRREIEWVLSTWAKRQQ